MSDATPAGAPELADVQAAVDLTLAALGSPVGGADGGDARWDRPAGELTWTCRRTLAHVVDAVNWYAALLARRADADIEVAEADQAAPLPVLFDSARSAAAVLAAVVAAAGPDARGWWHGYGRPDRSGFAAMGADEVLVHAHDLAAGLGVALDPPPQLCRPVLVRLFPWVDPDPDPWAALLWANGRIAFGGRPRQARWRWHSRPLEEWDGTAPSL